MARLQHKRPLCCRPRVLLQLAMLTSLNNFWKVVSCQRIGKDVDTGHADTHRDRAPIPRNSKLPTRPYVSLLIFSAGPCCMTREHNKGQAQQLL